MLSHKEAEKVQKELEKAQKKEAEKAQKELEKAQKKGTEGKKEAEKA